MLASDSLPTPLNFSFMSPHFTCFVSAILSYPLNTQPYEKVWETHVCDVWNRCDALRLLASLEWLMSTWHPSWLGCGVSCLQECLLLWFFSHQCAWEFLFSLLPVLTVIWKNWGKSSWLTHVKWSSCGCWQSVELREENKKKRERDEQKWGSRWKSAGGKTIKI